MLNSEKNISEEDIENISVIQFYVYKVEDVKDNGLNNGLKRI